jgi:hypothetical protein
MTRMSARLLVATLAMLAATAGACSGHSTQEPKPPPSAGDAAPTAPTFTLFALAEVRGQVGPCGCTSDPLGDLSRTSQVIAEARARGPVLVVDAGSLLYAKSPVPANQDGQEELKAELLLRTYKEQLQVAAIGLGPADLAKGAAKVRPARQVVNVTEPGLAVEPPKVLQVGDARVGVFGVVTTDALPGLTAGDPVAAGRAAVADLRGRGAQVVIALVQARTRKDAAKLSRDIGGVDVTVAGLGLNAPEPERTEQEAEHLGDGWLVIPANRGQILSRLDVTVRPGRHGLADAIGPAAAKARAEVLTRRLAELNGDLTKFQADPTADPGFVAAKRTEHATMVAERDALLAHPLVVPPLGSYFTFEQVRIAKGLACRPEVVSAIAAFDLAAGQANVKAAAAMPIAKPAKGAASYVGIGRCGTCHEPEVAFWKKTEHATAWQTLVDRGQQFDYECIGCHVTGFDKPGGSNLGHNDGLRDVQCETCHGPASIHVAKEGNDDPSTIHTEPPADLCASQCHTKEHSDTFQLEPYLRDILGPGHGEERRKALGDGPTGHALRKVALDKAGKARGAGCTK